MFSRPQSQLPQMFTAVSDAWSLIVCNCKLMVVINIDIDQPTSTNTLLLLSLTEL